MRWTCTRILRTSPNQTIAVKMTHKSQSAPTETSLIAEANADTALVQEDAQRAGLIGGKEQKKNKNYTTKV